MPRKKSKMLLRLLLLLIIILTKILWVNILEDIADDFIIHFPLNFPLNAFIWLRFACVWSLVLLQLSITDQFKRTLLGIVMAALQRALAHTGTRRCQRSRVNIREGQTLLAGPWYRLAVPTYPFSSDHLHEFDRLKPKETLLEYRVEEQQLAPPLWPLQHPGAKDNKRCPVPPHKTAEAANGFHVNSWDQLRCNEATRWNHQQTSTSDYSGLHVGGS